MSHEKGKRTEYGVSAEQFIMTWQNSESAAEVSEKTGIPIPIVHARASLYRRKGVKLKKMKRSSDRGLDVDALNLLITKIEGGEEPSKPAKPAASPSSVRQTVEQVLASLKK